MKDPLSPIGVLAMFAISVFVQIAAGAQAASSTVNQWQPPRTPDDQPDIQGYWSNVYTPSPATAIEEAFWRRPREDKGQTRFKSPIVDPADGRIPYQAWALKKRLELRAVGQQAIEGIDPQARCFPSGVPRINYRYHESPTQILQPPGYVVFLHEFDHTYRVIPLTPGPRLGERLRFWMGDARGRWENHTLIVETSNLNGNAWFDETASFQSNAMRVTERFTFTDMNSIRYEVTVTDPTLFEQPWTMVFPLKRFEDPQVELLEQACHEGERSAKELVERLINSGRSR